MRILEDSPAVRVLEDRGVRKCNEQTARNLLRRGRDVREVSEDTGLELSRVIELQDELQSQV